MAKMAKNLKTLTKVGIIVGMLLAVASAQAQVTKTGTGTGTIPGGGSLTVSFDFTGTPGTLGASGTGVSLHTLLQSGGGSGSTTSATLTSPGNVTLNIWGSGNSVGSSGPIDITFNSTGGATWGAQSSGTYQPVDAFSGFNGQTISGVWTLTVSSVLGNRTIDSGTQLSLTAVPEPSAFAAVFGVMAMGMGAYRRYKKA